MQRHLSVSVKEGDRTFLGDLYLPSKAKGPFPLVAVVPEWWGKNEYIRDRAKKVAAELGYAALAVDVYGDGKTVQTPRDAQAQAKPLYHDPMLGVKRLRAFVTAATNEAKGTIDAAKVAVIGYCFGGTQALNLARAGGLEGGAKLVAVAAFHAGLASTLKSTGRIAPKLLVLHGEADSFIAAEEIAAFKEEMKAAGAEMRFVAYPGALHGFTNPKATENGEKFDLPLAYDAKADTASWNELKQTLETVFR